MGNCTPKPSKPRPPAPPPTAHLSGPETCLLTSVVRIALLYKPLTLHLSTSPVPTLTCGDDNVHHICSDKYFNLMHYLDVRFGGARVEGGRGGGLGRAVEIQHRGMERLLGRVVEWVGRREEAEGSERMVMRRVGRWYGIVVEMLLEHARMEETLLFPVVDAADRGFCRSVTEEHARDLPIMNGIKEDIKSIIVLDSTNPTYQEAIQTLHLRLKKLLENCKEHFEAEEKHIIPILEVAKRSGGECKDNSEVIEQMIDAMIATHSHLFHMFVAGLLPHEAMEYLHMLCWCRNKDKILVMLRALAEKMENSSFRVNGVKPDDFGIL